MKWGIISDIHANLPALKSVFDDARDRRCEQFACLGDIVGYGRQPRECVKTIRDSGMPCVKGNHDDYVSQETLPGGFNPAAEEMIRWTKEQLSEADRAWLRSLPLTFKVADFVLVHASLDEPGRWPYVFDKLAAAAHFAHQENALCFFGHTHVPVAFTKDSVVRGGTFTKLRIETKGHYFVNPGAVGQPRDHDRRAAYAVYDSSERTVELRRVEYPMQEAWA